MEVYGIHLGLKVGIWAPLWAPSIYHVPTWTLWEMFAVVFLTNLLPHVGQIVLAAPLWCRCSRRVSPKTDGRSRQAWTDLAVSRQTVCEEALQSNRSVCHQAGMTLTGLLNRPPILTPRSIDRFVSGRTFWEGGG